MSPEIERITLPVLPPAQARPPFPYIAAIAPLAVAVVLWIITSSPFALLFAVLGPVLVVASSLDARRSARKARERQREEAQRRLSELEQRIDDRASAWRAAVDADVPALDLSCTTDRVLAAARRRIGTGHIASGVELVGDAEPDESFDAAVDAMRDRAAWVRDAPVVVEASEIHVDGPRAMVRAFARALVLSAAAAHSPADHRVVVPEGESWAATLPHRVAFENRWEVHGPAEAVLRVRMSSDRTTPRDIVVIFSPDGGDARILAPVAVTDFRPVLVSAIEACVRGTQIAERARRNGWDDDALLPESVSLARLLHDDGAPGIVAERGLAVAVGVDARGLVTVDLERDGPHALVAGTTGSGKSELLISWVLALAHRHPPDRVVFLLIDFKGGSAFAPLARLPHVVGVVSDLDPSTARRAVESLRAELRRRELLLAEHGARDISGLDDGVLPRLIVVVDEFAALLAVDAELSAVFSDLAARGRSLGLHLILCTQRPAGIVREGVLANITLRLCLRVLDASDSVVLVATRAAADLPAGARGRAIVSTDGAPRIAQLALAEPELADRVVERWRDRRAPHVRPWLDPLPALLPAHRLAGPTDDARLAVGMVDLPSAQTQRVLDVDPWAEGAIVLIGAPGSGRTTGLGMLAHASSSSPHARDTEIRWVPDDPAELWQALTTPAELGRVLVLADDIDRTVGRLDAEQRADLIDLVCRAARECRRTRIALAASMRSAGGALHGLQAAFDERLLLRLPSREEHVLAGGELAHHRADRRPGSLNWRGAEAQLAMPPTLPDAPWRAVLPVADLGDGPWGIACPRPRELIARAAAAGIDASAPGEGATVTIGDVDAWLAAFGALSDVRREGRMLLIGCAPSDHRTLARTRVPLPPLTGEDDAWIVESGATGRVRIRV